MHSNIAMKLKIPTLLFSRIKDMAAPKIIISSPKTRNFPPLHPPKLPENVQFPIKRVSRQLDEQVTAHRLG